MTYYENNSEILRLREYLRIYSVHPNINYDLSVEFLRQQASDLNLPIFIFYPSRPNKPVIIITWPGKNPELPAIMLNSHMDVAPVNVEQWQYDPFSAYLDKNDVIYGRGIQDAKALGMMYLAAIRELIKSGFKGQRTVHVTFMPDEEIGGREGMRAFVATNQFRKMNIGFALDGGMAMLQETVPVFYAERTKCQTIFKIVGDTGDISLLPKNTAGEKFNFLLKKFKNFRDMEVKCLQENTDLTLGDVSSVNLTMMSSTEGNGGLPSLIEARFDIRLSLKLDPNNFVRQWSADAGDGVEFVVTEGDFIKEVTRLDNNNQYWMTFKRVCEEEKMPIIPLVLPGASDSRYLRHIGIPVLNFTPMPCTKNRANDNNEYLKAETFLQGIEFYKKLIPALVNIGLDLGNEVD